MLPRAALERVKRAARRKHAVPERRHTRRLEGGGAVSKCGAVGAAAARFARSRDEEALRLRCGLLCCAQVEVMRILAHIAAHLE